MEEYREGKGIRAIWAAGERMLVAIGPDEQAERLVRAGKRMATALHADWIVVYVETPDLLRLSEHERDRRIALLRLAESLGAETVTLGGSSPGEEIANYARERGTSPVFSSGVPGARSGSGCSGLPRTGSCWHGPRASISTWSAARTKPRRCAAPFSRAAGLSPSRKCGRQTALAGYTWRA